MRMANRGQENDRPTKVEGVLKEDDGNKKQLLLKAN